MFRSIIQLSSHGNRRGPIHRALGTSTSTSTSTSTLPPDRFFATAESPDRILRNASTSTGTSTESAKNVARFEKVAFLGTGKIAQAIISPLIKTGLQPAERVAIFDVSVPAQSIPELVDGADLLVCAVKPQNITEGLCTELKKANIPINATFLSVIAGLPLQTYYATGYKKIVRSMPNTPAMIG
jgi:NADP oxidoreductase coenzyme F420-dependent